MGLSVDSFKTIFFSGARFLGRGIKSCASYLSKVTHWSANQSEETKKADKAFNPTRLVFAHEAILEDWAKWKGCSPEDGRIVSIEEGFGGAPIYHIASKAQPPTHSKASHAWKEIKANLFD